MKIVKETLKVKIKTSALSLLLIVIVVVIMTLPMFGGIGANALSVPNENTLFSSTFSTMDGLTITSGEFTVVDESLVPTPVSYSENRVFFDSTIDKTNYTIDLNATYFGGQKSRSGYAIYYRATNLSSLNAYSFQFDPGLDNMFVVRHVKDGNEKTPFQSVSMTQIVGSEFSMTDPHQITIQVKGTQHQIWIDGLLIFDFFDSTFTSGQVGLRSWHDSEVAFHEAEVNLINAYTVNFDANGGTGSEASVTADSGTNVVLPTAGFVKNGYTFVGWNTEQDAVSAFESYVVPVGDATLYAIYVSSYDITFDANGGTGSTGPTSMLHGTTLIAPSVSRPGYVLSGWDPILPVKVPGEDTTYTAQWTKTIISLTKSGDNLIVNIKGWVADNKYQIWSYQKIHSDIFDSVSVSPGHWIVSQDYTLGSVGELQTNGSMNFTIADFVSPDNNRTIAVRIMEPSTGESYEYAYTLKDAYTPTDMGQAVITKVLVDGVFSTGGKIQEIKQIATDSSVLIQVIGNDVANIGFTAKISGSLLTATSSNEFTWDTSALVPGKYTLEVAASNGSSTDTKEIEFLLYKNDSAIKYGELTGATVIGVKDNGKYKISISPTGISTDFISAENSWAKYSISASGISGDAKAAATGVTFTNEQIPDNKYGIYEVTTYLTRGAQTADDGVHRSVENPRPGEPKSFGVDVTIGGSTVQAGSATIDSDKGTKITFDSTAVLGTMGAGETTQYAYYRVDARGWVLIRDWGSSATLEWTPARVGLYTIQVRAKGSESITYEATKSMQINITDTTDAIAVLTGEITLSGATSVTARTPLIITANAPSTAETDLLYKYVISNGFIYHVETPYSVDPSYTWLPGKAGNYTVSVLVKNQVSFGRHDAIKSFQIMVAN